MQIRSEETRQHLLSAALRRFATYGYNAASVDDICRDAGLSKGAFYHHFPGKQAIFLTLLETWLASVDAGLEAARQPTIPATLMRMAAELPAILAVADGRLPMFLEFWMQASRDETIWQATISPYRRYQSYFASLIDQGISEGSFKPVDTQAAASMIVSLAVGTLLQALLSPEGSDWPGTIRENMSILMKGLSS